MQFMVWLNRPAVSDGYDNVVPGSPSEFLFFSMFPAGAGQVMTSFGMAVRTGKRAVLDIFFRLGFLCRAR